MKYQSICRKYKINNLLSIANSLKNKVVLMRVDFNVSRNNNGKIINNDRIIINKKTIDFLIQNGAKVILISHLGQPENIEHLLQFNDKTIEQKQKKQLSAVSKVANMSNLESFSFAPMIEQLSEIISYKIQFIPYSETETVLFNIKSNIFSNTINSGEFNRETNSSFNQQVFMLENIRFFKGEVENDSDLANMLAQYGELYINNAFSVSHRIHSSICAIAKLLPSYPGFALLCEIEELEKHMQCIVNDKNDQILPENFSNNIQNIDENNTNKVPINNSIAIIGGKKIGTKLPLILSLLQKTQYVFIGGAMANSILFAQGIEIGSSYHELIPEEYMIHLIKYINQGRLLLPLDAVCMQKNHKNNDENNVNIEQELVQNHSIQNIPENAVIFDIGSETISMLCDKIKKSNMLIWNGPLGVFEDIRFANGTKNCIETIIHQTKIQKVSSILGGGDTLSAITQFGYNNKDFTYVSTAGGAFLAWLESCFLPGILALSTKN